MIWKKFLANGGWRLLELAGGRETYGVLSQTREYGKLPLNLQNVRRDEMLASVLQVAVSEVPFFAGQQLASSLSANEQLSRFPIVTKDDLREDASRFISNRIIGKPGKSVSGGSTGVPVTCFTDPFAAGYVKAAAIEGRSWWNIHPWSRCLSLWGHSKYLADNWKAKVKLRRQRFLDAMANRRVVPAYDLSAKTAKLFNSHWHHDRPNYIIGYASALYEIARQYEELKLSPPPKNCLVMSTGEVLHDWQAEKIESTWGCPVFEEYGLVELGPVAYTDPMGDKLRIVDSHVWVEIVNDDGFPVAYGEEGRIVVSSLWRLGVPVIRYDTGDRAICLTQSGGSDCRTMSKVIGRNYDIIRDLDGNAIAGVIFTHAMKPLSNVHRFEVVQTEYGSVKINYVSDATLPQSITDGVRESVVNGIGKTFQVSFHHVDKLYPSKSGKYRWIRSEVRA